MFSALISFLGGSIFRMLWGEVSSLLNKWQDHRFEIERMSKQNDLEAAQHARNIESITTQANLGIKVIEAQRDADLDRIEGNAWLQAVQDVGKQTGIQFIDVWNGCIRPLLATLAIGVVVAEIFRNGFVLSDWDRELVAAILGIYVADRGLMKRGK